MGRSTSRDRFRRRATCAGVIALALSGPVAGCASAGAEEAPGPVLPAISVPGRSPFVPTVGDWEGSVDGFPASFELVYEPTYVDYGRPPYGVEDLTTIDPDSCPIAADRYSVSVVGQNDVTPLGVDGSLPLAGEGLSGGVLGPGSATLSNGFDTGPGRGGASCSGTLTLAMHPAKRRMVDDGAWALRFADGETQTFTVSAGGRAAIGIDLPAALGRCGGPSGNLNLFIGAGATASLRGTRGAYALRLSFTGANRASGRITAPTRRCRAFSLEMKATLSGTSTSVPRS